MSKLPLLATVCAGTAAGYATFKIVPKLGACHSTLARSLNLGGSLLLLLATLDFHFFWHLTADCLPVPRLSHQAIARLTPGNALGSTWSGCYEYQDRLPCGSGVRGAEGGFLRIRQENGALKASDGSAYTLLGGFDDNGRFRFGAETTTDNVTLRSLWEGKFSDNSLWFTRRITVFRVANFLNTTCLTGVATRIPCNR